MKKKNKKEPIWGWVDDDHISILWNVKDVKQHAQQTYGLKLNKEQCRHVLSLCLDNHDACIGISWDTISDYVWTLYVNKKKKVA